MVMGGVRDDKADRGVGKAMGILGWRKMGQRRQFVGQDKLRSICRISNSGGQSMGLRTFWRRRESIGDLSVRIEFSARYEATWICGQWIDALKTAGRLAMSKSETVMRPFLPPKSYCAIFTDIVLLISRLPFIFILAQHGSGTRGETHWSIMGGARLLYGVFLELAHEDRCISIGVEVLGEPRCSSREIAYRSGQQHMASEKAPVRGREKNQLPSTTCSLLAFAGIDRTKFGFVYSYAWAGVFRLGRRKGGPRGFRHREALCRFHRDTVARLRLAESLRCSYSYYLIL